MLGLSTKPQDDKKKDEKKETDKPSNSQVDEAKAILAKMEAKKDAGDCPFC